MAAGAHLGEQGGAEGRAFGRIESVDVVAINVGLDLTPERAPRAAAGEADLPDRDPRLADHLEAVAHGEGGPFDHASDEVRPAVPDGQADPGPLGVGVEMRGPLAG